MNFRLALSGMLSAALLAGCSSEPKLTTASGDWQTLPFTHAPSTSRAAVVVSAPVPLPPVTVTSTPVPIASPITVRKVHKVIPPPVPVQPAKTGDEPAVAPINNSTCPAK